MIQRRSWFNARRISSIIGKASILTILAVLVGGAIVGGRPGTLPVSTDRPELIIDESVAADFQALALQTWDRFLTVFWTRKDCFGDVYLRAAHTLDSRAAYHPDSATITVRVPATAAMLQGALIHEWAHHLEFQCREHEDLRAAFLLAQGLPGDTPWRMVEKPELAASAWADVPSEQYAEAVIALVLGGRPIPTGARLTAGAVQVLEKWAAGNLH
jgi:hypothetical protein